MDNVKKAKGIKLYIFSVVVLYLLLMIFSLVFRNEKNDYVFKNYEYKKTSIIENTENYDIEVNYPRFSNSKVASILTDYLYDYINNFKKKSNKTDKKEKLIINYEIEKFENYLNVFFRIDNSIKPDENFKSILIDTEIEKEVTIDNIYGEEISNEINHLFDLKYPNFILGAVEKLKLKDFSYSFKESHINIFVNKSLVPQKVNYNIFITKILNEKYVFEEIKVENQKYVAFTFDDGPSQYTKEVIDAFKSNNAHATFFMLGNRMKVMPDIVNYAIENGMEVASHSYSHKNLTQISEEEALEEINSSAIIYNEITGEDLKYLRPPYGAVNEKVKNLSIFPLITWSIDPHDWLNKDSEYIKEHVLSHIYDGSIILMHDLYPTSVEAVKILIPQLINQGYKLVTISELAEIKGKTLNPGEVIREIK